MPVRLVTREDLEKNPELAKKGVSMNQNYDFPDEPQEQQKKADDKKVVDDKKDTRNQQPRKK